MHVLYSYEDLFWLYLVNWNIELEYNIANSWKIFPFPPAANKLIWIPSLSYKIY